MDDNYYNNNYYYYYETNKKWALCLNPSINVTRVSDINSLQDRYFGLCYFGDLKKTMKQFCSTFLYPIG